MNKYIKPEIRVRQIKSHHMIATSSTLSTPSLNCSDSEAYEDNGIWDL